MQIEHRVLHLLARSRSTANELELSFIFPTPREGSPRLVMDTRDYRSHPRFSHLYSLYLLCRAVRFPRAFFFDRSLLIIRPAGVQ